MKLFHGTSTALGIVIKRDGLNPEGCTSVEKKFRKSCYSKPGYVYFTNNIKVASIFACGSVKKTGLGEGEILEIKDIKFEKDPLLKDSYRFKGRIPANKIKSFKIITKKECNRQM